MQVKSVAPGFPQKIGDKISLTFFLTWTQVSLTIFSILREFYLVHEIIIVTLNENKHFT